MLLCDSHALVKELGYEIERGESSQPEIKGYSKEYLEASSPRRQQIEEHLAKENQRGAGAAQIAAHQTREGMLELSHEEMQDRHRAMGARFGNQPERVVEAAQQQRERLQEEPGEKAIGHAVAYSREKNLEREAVAEERELLRDALKRSMGDRVYASEMFQPREAWASPRSISHRALTSIRGLWMSLF
jgi:hypothetical protein